MYLAIFSLIFSPIVNKRFFIIPISDQIWWEELQGSWNNLRPEIIDLGIQLFGSVGKTIEIVGYFQWSSPHPLAILILLGNLN